MWIKILNILMEHKGKIIGACLGLVISLLIILFGFFKTFFIALCVCFGYILGKKVDNNEDIRKLLEKILPPGF